MRSGAVCLVALITVATASCSQDSQAPMGPENLTLAAPAETFTDNFIQTFPALAFIPCANGGNGEFVQLQVVWRFLTHLTINDNHFTLKTLIHEAGTSGVGLTTGDKYHATGATNETITGSFNNGQFSDTFTESILVIGQGPSNNLRIFANFHVTINANGEVTVVIDSVFFECK